MSTDTEQAVVLASGGMDSATAAVWAQQRGYTLQLLHASYGQVTQSYELKCARQLAESLDVPFQHLHADHLAAIGGSSLTEDDTAIEDADRETDAVPATYVPFRNGNLLAMAVSYAEANECDAVVIGAHGEDNAGYPDCQPAFFEAFQRVVDTGTKPDTEIEILAPFAEWSKTEIAERGLELDVPFELTWSCYRDDPPACGTCDACKLRLEAFQRLGARDPIVYDQRPTYAE